MRKREHYTRTVNGKCRNCERPKYRNRGLCLKCLAQYQVETHSASKHQKNRKKTVMRNQYGLEPEDYQAMLEAQEHTCAVCEEKVELWVDHDHRTNKVRGLLCPKCNNFMAALDSPLFEKLLAYKRSSLEIPPSLRSASRFLG